MPIPTAGIKEILFPSARIGLDTATSRIDRNLVIEEEGFLLTEEGGFLTQEDDGLIALEPGDGIIQVDMGARIEIY
jgi:hypothetical protein